MFSATFSSEIKKLANEFLNNLQFIWVDAVNTAVKKNNPKNLYV